jgi:hypothetical protein
MARFNPIAIFIVVFGIASSAAYADTVSYEQLLITSPTLAFGASNPDDVIVAGATSSLYPGYTLSAEFCENSSCTNPIVAPEDSLLRLTNLTLTCTAKGGCGLIDIDFEADSAILAGKPAPASLISVDLSLDGTATEAVSGAIRLCITNPHAICSSNLSGPLSFQTTFADGLNGGTSGSVIGLPGFTVYGQIEIDHLDNGNSVTLVNSLDIGADLTAIPEPATLALVVPALLLLVAARFRKAWKS